MTTEVSLNDLADNYFCLSLVLGLMVYCSHVQQEEKATCPDLGTLQL